MKKLFFLVLILSLNILNAQENNSVCINTDSLISYATKYIGTPYRYGNSSPKGFDCSGFVYYVFKKYGKTLPRTSRDMAYSGKEIKMEQCRKGDIILFKGTNAKSNSIGHAAIVISNEGEPLRFIHSSSNKKRSGVIISSFNDSPYYTKRFVKIVRLEECY